MTIENFFSRLRKRNNTLSRCDTPKAEFLSSLRKKINSLPPRDVEETLEYYSEMIDDYIENGYSPEEAVAKMGRVEDIAAQILASPSASKSAFFETPAIKKQPKRKEGDSSMTLLLLILGFPLWFPLLLTAFCLLLTFPIVLITLAIVLPWSLVVSFGASALALLVATPIICVGEGLAAMLITFGAALVLGALCVFCLWVGLRLAGISIRAVGATFRAFFDFLFGRRNNK